MAIRILASRNSFVQFNESNVTTSCEFGPVSQCLPVFQSDDVAFQFYLEADDEGEADTLCDPNNDKITIGIALGCDEDNILEFDLKPDRFRVSPTKILYNWAHGLPNFQSVISIGQCFVIKILLQNIYANYEFCSVCFQRIEDDCHTSVINYGNDDNAFGFDYCGGSIINDESGSTECEPTIITFTNQSNIVIPYTASLLAKYGTAPTIKVWIYDGADLVDFGIRVSLDAFPPSQIKADFGGLSSGIVKIS